MAHQYTTMVLEWLNVVNNVQPCRCLTNGIQRRSNVVMLSGTVVKLCILCVCFRGELGLLNCDNICMCVMNKQFDLLEFVFDSIYVDL